MNGYVVRYHSGGLFTAECQACVSLVRKRSMRRHARWHAGQGTPERLERTVRSFCDGVSVRHPLETSWSS